MPRIPRSKPTVSSESTPTEHKKPYRKSNPKTIASGVNNLQVSSDSEIHNIVTYEQLADMYNSSSTKFPTFKKYVKDVISTNKQPLSENIDVEEVANYNKRHSHHQKRTHRISDSWSRYDNPNNNFHHQNSHQESHQYHNTRKRSNTFSKKHNLWFTGPQCEGFSSEEMKDKFSKGEITIDSLIGTEKNNLSVLITRIESDLPIFDTPRNILLMYAKYIKENYTKNKAKPVKKERVSANKGDDFRASLMNSKMLNSFFQNRVNDLKFKKIRGLFRNLIFAKNQNEIEQVIEEAALSNGMKVTKVMVEFGNEFYKALEFEIACKNEELKRKNSKRR